MLMLVTLPLAYSLEECQAAMTSGEIPCLILSTWTYPNSCNTYNIKIYNETPSLLSTVTMDSYGITGRCNITFNYTTHGSYLLNYSSGDSATIIVEGDEMSYVGIGILLAAITFIFAFMATKVKGVALQIGLSLMTLVMVVFDFFIAARIIEAVDSSQVGIISNLDTFYWIAIQFLRFALWGVMIFIVWWLYKIIKSLPEMRRQKREREYLYD